jgi:hypothetical protein
VVHYYDVGERYQDECRGQTPSCAGRPRARIHLVVADVRGQDYRQQHPQHHTLQAQDDSCDAV